MSRPPPSTRFSRALWREDATPNEILEIAALDEMIRDLQALRASLTQRAHWRRQKRLKRKGLRPQLYVD